MYTVGHSRILSVGAYTPPNVISSRELMEAIDSKNRFNIDPDWLERSTGIKTRRACDPGVLPSDMAVHSAREALDHASCTPQQVDAIIYAGIKRDNIEPATAHNVQRVLGATNAVVMDITNACLGFMSAIHVMDSLIATGQVRRGLIVAGEQGFPHTKINIEHLLLTHDKKEFHRLFAGLTLGDAGAAILLGPKIDPDSGILQVGVASAGQHADLCTVKSETTPIYANMSPLFAETTRLVRQVYTVMMRERLKWSPKEIDLYVPHQVGLKANKAHAITCSIDLERIPNTVDRMGNIASATIPYALANLPKKIAPTVGQKIFFSGTGSGISVAQAGIVWDVAA